MMKKHLTIIATFIVLFITAEAAAQSRYGTQYNGVDRSMTGQQYGNKSKKNEEKVDVIELSMQKLNSELTLDSFQGAVIRQLLEENQVEEKKIIDEDIPNESKTEKIIALRDKLNIKIKDILTPGQKEKFEAMMSKKKK